MESNSIRINSDGTGRGTQIFFQTNDGKEMRVNNCINMEIGVSAGGIGFVKMELINFELNYRGNPVFKIKEEDFEKTFLFGEVYPWKELGKTYFPDDPKKQEQLNILAELSQAYDSVNSLYVRSITEVERSKGQSLQKDIILNRLKELDEEILKISPVRDMPDLCESCKYHIAECASKSIIFGIDRFPNLRGSDADRVIECGMHEEKG